MLEFTFDGRRVPLEGHDTIGSALHRAGVRVIGRSMKYHRPRGLYCMAGSCASCLVDVDGEPNVPACTREAQPGLVVRSQNRIGTAKHDLLGIVDKVYAKGFDPHGAFTRPRIVNDAFLKGVRFMSGVGRAPDAAPPAKPKRVTRSVGLLVVGAGAQGLAAENEWCFRQDSIERQGSPKGQATRSGGADPAQTVTSQGAPPPDAPAQGQPAASNGKIMVVDEGVRPGGSALWDPREKETLALAHELNKRVEYVRGLCFGIYGHIAAMDVAGDLWEVDAARIVIATGHHEGQVLFGNNDLPGVLTVGAARRLIHAYGVAPGRMVVQHGDVDLEDEIVRLGGKVVATGVVDQVRGGANVERARVDDQWYSCDTVICQTPTVPRIELMQQAGCSIVYRNGTLLAQGMDYVEGRFGGG